MSKYYWVRTHKNAQDDYVTGSIDQLGFEAILARLGINAVGIREEIEELKQERIKCLME